jgi:heat shock protein HslJ
MRQYLPIASAITTLLSGCHAAPSPETPTAELRPYAAIGTEPFWSFKIEDGSMRFQLADQPEVRTFPFEARPGFNGWRYSSDKMQADVSATPCSDGMSDKRYKDTVTVMVGGKQYKGCGGGVLAPLSLDGTSWTIVTLGGKRAVEGIATEVRFSDGKISGSAGCNHFGGPYSETGKNLKLGAVFRTEMGCPEPQMGQENKFLALLNSGELSMRFSVTGDLILTNAAGDQAVLKRNI